jgi:hypothetical protein
MKLGTYSTIDCPTAKIDEAYNFLVDKFNDINGRVRKVFNSHDIQDYPSFEIDYPNHLEDINDDMADIWDDEDKEHIALVSEKYRWEKKAQVIQNEYSEKFNKYL